MRKLTIASTKEPPGLRLTVKSALAPPPPPPPPPPKNIPAAVVMNCFRALAQRKKPANATMQQMKPRMALHATMHVPMPLKIRVMQPTAERDANAAADIELIAVITPKLEHFLTESQSWTLYVVIV
jgi:hypothetical protein